MGHVGEAALGVDRVDRLPQRHAARDLLLDEEPDHLALVRGLDLLRHDHLDPVRALARLERARDLVVVGDRDRAQAALLRGLEQHVHRRRAIRRVVGVHVQVAVDELARAQAAARSRAGRPAAGGGARSRAGRCARPRRPRGPSRSRGRRARQRRRSVEQQLAVRRPAARAARPAPPRRRARTATRRSPSRSTSS